MGNAADFDLSWYLLVGVALGNTMLINAFTMQLPFLAAELLVNPLKRLMQSTAANRVSQIHLNKAYAPSAFKIPIRLAMLVNTLIISLLFSSALPLLLPLAFVAFTTAYVVDKVSLLRHEVRFPSLVNKTHPPNAAIYSSCSSATRPSPRPTTGASCASPST